MRSLPAVFLALLAALAVAAVPTAAQTSAHYRLTESAFNAGGDPKDGVHAVSTHHKVTLDAIGDAALATSDPRSASHRLSGGFVIAYVPPGEVLRLWLLADHQTLRWTPEPSIGSYNLYRGMLSAIPPTFGNCFRSRIAADKWGDMENPSAGTGFFYLVTARNRLDEEGPKGFQSSGTEEPNPDPCP